MSPLPARLKLALVDLAKGAASLYWDLLKTMIPVMVVVQIGVSYGLIDQLAVLFEPLMSLVDLPAATGIVWATGILVNNYGAAAALVGILPYTDLTVAQLTVLLSMVLIAHALPLEQAISRKAGISFTFSTTLRFGGGLAYGAILNAIYSWGNWLQEPATIAWLPADGGQDVSWDAWAVNSAVSLFWLFWIILGLVTVLKIFEILKITDLLARLLSPLLGLMGISRAATSDTKEGAG